MDILIHDQLLHPPEGVSAISRIDNYYHQLLYCLGETSDYPAVGELLRLYHGLKGSWLVVSPIHWHATHNDAMIVQSGADLKLTPTASQAWFSVFEAFIKEDGSRLYYHDAYTWLLQCDNKPEIKAKPVHTMHHQSLAPVLKTLDDTLFWQRFLTESQLFFSAHALNMDRSDLPILNGLWCWGGGEWRLKNTLPLIYSGQEAARLAVILSVHTEAYDPGKKYPKNTVFLFDSLNEDERRCLEHTLAAHRVRWFWANTAYLQPPKGFFSRFRERIREC